MTQKRQQELFLDGIELTIKMVELAYKRLEFCAIESSPFEGYPREFEAPLFLDAWSFIDSVNRLRLLVTNTPGLKRTPAVMVFLKVADETGKFRNYVQHLPGEVNELAGTGAPIWGSIGWWFMTPEMKGKGKAMARLIIPGRLAKGNGIGMLQVPGTIRAVVDHIQLTVAGRHLDLSDVRDSVSRFSQRFQEAVKKAEEGANPGEIIRVEPSN